MAERDLKAVTRVSPHRPWINRPNQPKNITVPMFESVFPPAWLAAFAPKRERRRPAPTGGIARRRVPQCGRWATAGVPHPRTMTMATDNSRFLAGNPKGLENSEVPNITPDRTTGLTWTVEEIANYPGTGTSPMATSRGA